MSDNGGFYQIDNNILREYGPRLGVYGIAVYNVLAMYANGDGGGIFPSYDTIAEQLGISRRKVISTIDQLCELGLVTKENRRRKTGVQTSNAYCLVKQQSAPHAPSEDRVHDMHHQGAQGALGYSTEQSAPHAPDQYPDTYQHPSDQDPGRERAPATVGLPVTIKRKPAVRIQSPYLASNKFIDGYVPPGTGTNAVQVYYERFDITHDPARLSSPQEDDLVRICQDLDHLRDVVTAYSRTNYRPGNVQLILDWYRQGIPNKYQATNNTGNSRVSRSMAAVDEVLSHFVMQEAQQWITAAS